MKDLLDGSRCVALLNRGESPLEMTVSWFEAGLSEMQLATVRDLWQHQDLGIFMAISAQRYLAIRWW